MNKDSRRKPTVRDVARQAGVSIGTVSNALNRPEYIHPDTLAKVRKAIAHLNFIPSPGAQSRRRKPIAKKSVSEGESIGILLLGNKDLHWIVKEAPIYAYALHGAEQAATQLRWPCQILHARDMQDVKEIWPDLPKGGLVLLSKDDLGPLPEGFSLPPIVKIMGFSNTRWGDCCTYNSYGAGRVAAEYLWESGCRIGACIGGVERGVPAIRMQGFDDAFTTLGGKVAPRADINLFPESHLPDEAAMLKTVKFLLKHKPKIDGIFVTADMLAPLLYRVLGKLDIQPQKDIKIVTCNNERPYLAGLKPEPAVVDIHGEMIGAEAVKLLAWRKANPHEPRRTLVIEPTLVLPKAK
jgi:DNA-binding LacI/PurR family transcriptional regulator